jgi:hypothetical protein
MLTVDNSTASLPIQKIKFSLQQVLKVDSGWESDTIVYDEVAQEINGPRAGERMEDKQIEIQIPEAETRDMWDLPKGAKYWLKRNGLRAFGSTKLNNTTHGKGIKAVFQFVEKSA